MDFSINEVVIDFNSTFGKNFALVDVISKAVYKDGNKTNETILHYDVCCLDNKMKHLDVKILGKQLLPVPENGDFIRVELIEPVARQYIMNGKYGISISASSIKEIK